MAAPEGWSELNTSVDQLLTELGGKTEPADAQNTVEQSGTMYDAAGVSRTVQYAYVDASSSGNTAVVAAQGSGVKVRVLSCKVVASAAVTVKFNSASTQISASDSLAANGGYVLPYSPHGWFETAANEALNVNLSGAVATGVTVTWLATT
jgi:hypothetical protein